MSFTNIFDKKYFDICVLLFKYSSLTFAANFSNIWWKVIAEKNSRGLQHRIKETWSVYKTTKLLSNPPQEVSMSKKTFHKFTFWIGYKFLSSKYLLCINNKKSIFQYSHRFRRQWQWKQFFARLSLHFVLKMNTVIMFPPLFCYRSLFLSIYIFACVMLSYHFRIAE